MRFATPRRVLRFVVSALVVWLAADAAVRAAGPSSDTLLPKSTKGYLSIAQPEEMKARWRTTQWGRMFDDEVMQPFVEDLRKQLGDKLNVVKEKLGVTYDDLDGVPAGESSLAIIERDGKPAALALTIDVTGHDAQRDRLLAKVEERFKARRGRKEVVNHIGTAMSVFTIPAAASGAPAQVTVYFVKDNVLCGIDDRAEAEAMLARFAGGANDNLKSVAAYKAAMEKCGREAKEQQPELRYFAEPFGFIFAARTLDKAQRNPHDKDFVKIMRDQGFSAIQGMGGFINLLVDDKVEILHRAAIHAPPLPGKENDPLRWDLAMRIMQLPNAPATEPPSWVPRSLAGYSTINVKPLVVFDNIGSLVDAIRGHKGAFANSMEGFKIDKYGPQVDVREDFIKNFGQRITVVTDYRTPITVGSEQSLVAIELIDEKKVTETLEKWMKKEPDTERRELGRFIIWERVPPAAQQPDIAITSTIFGGLPEEEVEKPKDEKERDRVLPNSAYCVALGQLIIASDIEYLKVVLEGFGRHERLASCEDYQGAAATLAALSPGDFSGWSFGRTDEEFRPTFELVRQGKMPEAKTMLGKLLNNLLTTEVEKEEGKLRKQRIDASRLPNFEAVRRYFGPAGRKLRSDEDGWLYTDAVLKKEL